MNLAGARENVPVDRALAGKVSTTDSRCSSHPLPEQQRAHLKPLKKVRAARPTDNSLIPALRLRCIMQSMRFFCGKVHSGASLRYVQRGIDQGVAVVTVVRGNDQAQAGYLLTVAGMHLIRVERRGRGQKNSRRQSPSVLERRWSLCCPWCSRLPLAPAGASSARECASGSQLCRSASLPCSPDRTQQRRFARTHTDPRSEWAAAIARAIIPNSMR